MTDLIILPTEEADQEQFFIQGADLGHVFKKIEDGIKDLPLDMEVRKNREEVASYAYKIAQTKTAIEKVGLEVARKYKELPKKIDANRKAIKDTLEALQLSARSALNAYEQRDKERQEAHESKIAMLNAYLEAIGQADLELLGATLDTHQELQKEWDFEEYAEEAERILSKSIPALQARIDEVTKLQAQEKELEELRKIKEEAERKEREAKIAEEAKLKAEADAQAKIAEAEAKAAEAAKQERLRIAAEQHRQAEEDVARAANVEHRRAINQQSLQELLGLGIVSEEQAKGLIKAIAANKLTYIKIGY